MDNITSDNKQSATNTKAHKNKKGLTTNKTIKNPEPRTAYANNFIQKYLLRFETRWMTGTDNLANTNGANQHQAKNPQQLEQKP